MDSDGGWFASGGLGGSFIGTLEVRRGRSCQVGRPPSSSARRPDEASAAALTFEQEINQASNHVPATPKLMKALLRLLIVLAASGFSLADADQRAVDAGSPTAFLPPGCTFICLPKRIRGW